MSKPGGKKREGRQEGDSPRTVSRVPLPKTPHSDTGWHKNPLLGGPPQPPPAAVLEDVGHRPRLASAHRGASAPSPTAGDRTGDPMPSSRSLGRQVP